MTPPFGIPWDELPIQQAEAAEAAGLTLPTIHLNGTSVKDLRTEYDAAADALESFKQAWSRITCNARDYYVQGPDAYSKARDERAAIGSKIGDISDYLDEIRAHLHSI